MRYTQYGVAPAVYFPVFLQNNGKMMKSYTGPDGWYYFNNLTPSVYFIVIQSNQNSQRIRVDVTSVPYFVVPPVTIR